MSESLDVRRLLRRLARQVQRGSKNVRQMGFIESAIGECLDEAATVAAERERWLLCEGATWGLAWMARTRRAGGSAGGILERITKMARGAQEPLAAGDTRAARFVLAVARLFVDIEACRCLETGAAAALAGEIGRLVSSTGAVCLPGSTTIVERIVRWCSAREVAVATGGLPWDEATESRFTAAVAFGLRLLGRQGRLLAGAGAMPQSASTALLLAAGDSPQQRTRRSSRVMREKSGAGATRPGKKRSRRLLPRDMHDPDAAVAVLRSGWDRTAIRVLLDYRDAVPHLEIAVADRFLVEGPWQWRGSRAGRPLVAEGPWRLSCWESDRKATFLEIVAPLEGGMQIDRQILLLPRDGVVLLADAVTHPPQAADRSGDRQSFSVDGLELQSVVPLASSLEGESGEETREILVYDTKARFMAMPLGLPEWTAAGGGSFAARAEGLVLEHRSSGSRCYSPLWLDFDVSRQGKPLTWRQLTVADTRRNLPPQQAVGFRVQHGLEQWLVYRSLDEPRNRTVLGCNISCDFLVGTIGRTGIVDRAIEIE